jgi:hypothetical protein
MHSLDLVLVPGDFSIRKLESDAAIPSWASASPFFSITRTSEELSIVCRQESVPADVDCESGWRCLRVAGKMPFDVVGVLAALTSPLAEAGIPLFAMSTYDTDYLFVKEVDLGKAIACLRHAGHAIRQEKTEMVEFLLEARADIDAGRTVPAGQFFMDLKKHKS